ncbi:hypothetical protein MKW98_013021, partial [Papaver atlanticum]
NKQNNENFSSERRDEEDVPHASKSLPPATDVVSNETYGGPQNMSLLITYKDHIAARIWSGE